MHTLEVSMAVCAIVTIFLPSCSTVPSAWKRFDKLHEEYAATVLADTGEPFADLYDVEGYGKVDGVKLPVDFIIDNFEELKVCKAVCGSWTNCCNAFRLV